MQLEIIGQLELDDAAIAARFRLKRGAHFAIQGISISNSLWTAPRCGKPKRLGNLYDALSWQPQIDALEEIGRFAG